MGAVYEQFEVELDVSPAEAGRPRREMVHLLLLALEREEIVSVGYREAMIARRLAGMPIGPQLRELIAHALAGPGRTRRCTPSTSGSAILRLGSRSLKARAYVRWPVPWEAGPAPCGSTCTGARPLGPIPGHDDRRDGRPHRAGPPRRPPAPASTAPSATSACSTSTPSSPPAAATNACWTAPEVPELSSNLVDDLGGSATTRIGTSTSSPSWPSARREGPSRAGVTPDEVARRIGEVGEDFLLAPCDRPCLAPARRRRPRLGRRGGLARGQAAPLPPPAGRRRPGGSAPRPRAGPRPTGRELAGGHQADLHARLSSQGSPT